VDTRYKFNGIERVQDFGLNMDMAMYRSYDPAIGRWWQIDPLAALAPEQTPYRFGFNSPMNFTDPWGLFETRREAREYKEENDVEGRVKKQKDGSFAIVNKKEKYSVTKDKQYGVSFQKLGKAPKDDKPKFDENVHPTPVPDWLNGIYTSWPAAEGEGYVWYDKEHNVVPYDPPINVAHWLGRMFDGVGMLTGGSKVIGAVTGATRGLWTLTKRGASAIKNHKTFGTIYKSKSDGLWWAVDKAGHGGSKFKVFKETKKGLEWYRDADEFGDFILDKHKGSTGTFIPWGQLSTVK
jgi:RHS repeat-associated protein